MEPNKSEVDGVKHIDKDSYLLFLNPRMGVSFNGLNHRSNFIGLHNFRYSNHGRTLEEADNTAAKLSMSGR